VSRKTKSSGKQKSKDQELRDEILELRKKHKNYGSDRLAIALNRPKSVVHRVVKKYNLQIKCKRKHPFKPEDLGFKASHIPNLTKNLTPLAPDLVWASDFTYLKYENKTYYLATFLDIYSRKIVGWNFSDTHDTELILEALKKAVKAEDRAPDISHSDQGSEYRSQLFQENLKSYGIRPSLSPKASPWRNGFQESFYAGFKKDLGDINRFKCLGELIEAIAHTIHYYNTDRIHTALKTNPKEFIDCYMNKNNPPKKEALAVVIDFHKVVP
jgi:transposase InsO family protein